MHNKTENKIKGAKGEDEAVDILVKKGYKILERNWVSGKLEIDIIATTGKYVVFVEVKTRHSNTYAEPWEAVNKKKQQHILRAAHYYIRKMTVQMEPRFDIISIISFPNKELHVDHFEDAFWPMA
jgi:putative endonuclease